MDEIWIGPGFNHDFRRAFAVRGGFWKFCARCVKSSPSRPLTARRDFLRHQKNARFGRADGAFNLQRARRNLGLILLPIMLYHSLQLIICGALAGRWAQRAEPVREESLLEVVA